MKPGSRKKGLSIVGLLASLMSGVVLAQPWISLEAGYGFAADTQGKKIMTLPNYPAAPVYDYYKTTDREDALLLGMVIGYSFDLPQSEEGAKNIRLGIGYEYVGQSEVEGTVVKYLEQPSYDYRYKIQSQVLWLGGQVDVWKCAGFVPFIDLGIGVAFNQAQDYEEARKNDQVPVRMSADFENKTHGSFAWRIGAGINYEIPRHEEWVMGMLVRYSDLGEVYTGDSPAYASVTDLKLPYTHTELMLVLRYQF